MSSAEKLMPVNQNSGSHTLYIQYGSRRLTSMRTSSTLYSDCDDECRRSLLRAIRCTMPDS